MCGTYGEEMTSLQQLSLLGAVLRCATAKLNIRTQFWRQQSLILTLTGRSQPEASTRDYTPARANSPVT